ncbi:glycosyltransferase [Rhodobacteraceae bacterium R_SAG6]|nr:glycosyltransferase [Rhodobacteraceae bacterium R_SAG6]
MIRFSVITVVRNDPVGVIRTLQSVFSQTYECVEVIVQDGASTDETSDVLRNFEHWIDSLVIEPDDGIYDAMNRALRRSTGDYCIFMNAADFFVDNDVLDRVAKRIDPAQHDIWSGKILSDETGKVHTYRPADQFWAGSTCDHQATFIRTSLMQELEYDVRYKIAGDLHFFTRARKQNARFFHDDLVIARKPFAVGASSDFTDRIIDRIHLLEEAWGEEYPVRDTITRELRHNICRRFDVSVNHLEGLSIDELLKKHDLLNGVIK